MCTVSLVFIIYDVCACVSVRARSYRFEVVVVPQEDGAGGAASVLLNKELAAESQAMQDAWIKDIQEVH